MVIHPLEDCFVFKDWVEKQYQDGKLSLSDKVLQIPKKEHTNLVSVSPTMILPSENLTEAGDSNWAFVLSKKSLKLLRRLEAMHTKSRRPVNICSNAVSIPRPVTEKSKSKREVDASSLKPKQVILLDFIP